MNSQVPSHIQQELLSRFNLKFCEARISRANHMFDLQRDRELKDDVQAAIATNRCVGYEIGWIDELRIDVELAADTMVPEELAQIKFSIDHRADELESRSERFIEAMGKRWPYDADRVGKTSWFYSAYIFAKSTSTTIEEIHREILLNNDEPTRGGVVEQIIADMVGELYGLGEYIDAYREPDVPANATTDSIRAETKASVERATQIFQSLSIAT